MAYTKTIWENDITSLSASNLNKIEDQVEILDNRTAVDYIVEQGTSGVWTYRKWNSGIAECWGMHSVTISNYTTVFGGYGYYTTVTFPTGLFNTYPKSLQYSAQIGNGFAITGTLTSSISKTSANIYAVSSASGSQTTYWYVHAIGTWK